ncbi:hypothetical protein QFW96_09640 [Saccharopolyspora sp. TS4A08]|uniref:Asp23/Gls24 family envelope stress response protein n=1 Tax=Saccharopolyspora ipomoeae TaxID=3042027 RepID=A0ABT6PLK0_9PSEU|nr:hypothetical protein [Saccharopolyspora sp. TS4A08]MDI2028874.1 hypothetical protein [Saccharopolyspora sp. TS4A08]
MGEASFDPEQRLSCGHTIGELVEHLAGDAPPEFAAHVASCPHCQAAMAGFGPGWAPVRRAAEVAVETPNGLLDRALLTARRARGLDSGPLIEIAQDGGALRVTPHAALVLARRLSAELLANVPGARVLACTGDSQEICVELEVSYGSAAPELATRLRTDLEDALRVTLGPGVPAVWVRIADVVPPEAT